MDTQLTGLHHVTAIVRDAQRSVDFYTRVLGMRLVKHTQNFADPSAPHLYFGDWSGAPGTLLTVIAWPQGEPGRHGAGAAGEVALAIPLESLGFWIGHLVQLGVPYAGPTRRLDEQVLALRDPDGLLVELVGTPAALHAGWDGGTVPAEHTVRGLHHVTLWADGAAPTRRLLTETLGLRAVAEHDRGTRYALGAGGPGALLELRDVAGFWPASLGTGSVHHVALRTPDDRQQLGWSAALTAAEVDVSPVIDRRYFRSLYAREPGGAILEIATDGPGLTVDEPLAELGTHELPAPEAPQETDMAAVL